ncbi:MAG: MFS transporter [Acidimicrobiales bacterium]
MSTRWLYALNFLMASSIGLVFVFLADIQDLYGLADWQLGFVASMGFLSALVTQLALAPLLDRGHVKELAWASVAIGALGTIGFAFANSFWLFGLSRGMSGVGLGLFGVVARKALIGLDIEGGGAKVGAMLSTGVAGFLTGPGLGAALGSISFETPFVILAVLIVLVGIPAARIAANTPIATAPVDYSDVGWLLAKPRVQVAILAQIMVFGFIGVFDSIVDRYLTDLGAGTTAIAITVTITGAPLLILPMKAGALAERVGGARVVLPALVLSLPCVVLFGVASGAAMFAAIGVFQGASESFSSTGAQVLVLEASGAARSAIGSAILEAIGMAVAATTSILAPIIYGASGPGTLFNAYAAFSALIVVLAALRIRSIPHDLPT